MKSDIKIWSVKQHSKDGFICKDYEGTVVSLALYGRKEKVAAWWMAVYMTMAYFYPYLIWTSLSHASHSNYVGFMFSDNATSSAIWGWWKRYTNRIFWAKMDCAFCRRRIRTSIEGKACRSHWGSLIIYYISSLVPQYYCFVQIYNHVYFLWFLWIQQITNAKIYSDLFLLQLEVRQSELRWQPFGIAFNF